MEQDDARVAIVTGAGAGIGAACAKALAAAGYRVVVADLVAESAAATVAEIEAAGGTAVAVAVDIADEERVRAMVDIAITHLRAARRAAQQRGRHRRGVDPGRRQHRRPRPGRSSTGRTPSTCAGP